MVFMALAIACSICELDSQLHVVNAAEQATTCLLHV